MVKFHEISRVKFYMKFHLEYWVSVMHKASAWSGSVDVRSHDLRCVYQVIRELAETGKSPARHYLTIPSKEREQHFRSIFAGARQPADSTIMLEMSSLADSEKAAKWRRDTPATAPSLAEIEAAIHRLKIGTAAWAKGRRYNEGGFLLL